MSSSIPILASASASATATTTEELVRLAEEHASTGGRVTLGPYDLLSMGRSTPMSWFYTESLDVDLLLSSLRTTLSSYPVLCGRYDGASPPTAVILSNMGVAVTTSHEAQTTMAEACAHLPAAEGSIFARVTHEPYVPAKAPMDPDQGSPDAPVLALKITTFANGGGTAIGMLVQHGVLDGEAEIQFMAHWSQAYRGLELSPPPVHARCFISEQAAAADAPPAACPANFHVRATAAGEMVPPEFLPVMPKINGPDVCVVPFSTAQLAKLKADASAELGSGAEGGGEGGGSGFVSTDDVLSAHVWRAMCRMRLGQLGLQPDTDALTTLGRATNFRSRTEPPLPRGYAGNAAASVTTQMSVRNLLELPIAAVASRLRGSMEAHTAADVQARADYLNAVYRTGGKVRTLFDAHALTFIVSSWRFNWEAAAFADAPPVAYDHGALVPIVAVFTNQPKGGGVLVYTSGPQESLEGLAKELAAVQGAVCDPQ